MAVKQRSVYIPDEHWHHLRTLALGRGVTASTLLDEIVAEWCERNPLPVAVVSPLREGADPQWADPVVQSVTYPVEAPAPAPRSAKPLTADQILARVNRGKAR